MPKLLFKPKKTTILIKSFRVQNIGVKIMKVTVRIKSEHFSSIKELISLIKNTPIKWDNPTYFGEGGEIKTSKEVPFLRGLLFKDGDNFDIIDENFYAFAGLEIKESEGEITLTTCLSGFKYRFFDYNGKMFVEYNGALKGFNSQYLNFMFYACATGNEMVKHSRGKHYLLEYLLKRNNTNSYIVSRFGGDWELFKEFQNAPASQYKIYNQLLKEELFV